MMSVKFGNLPPNSEIKLKLTLLMQLKVVKASYEFEVPFALTENYYKEGKEYGTMPFKYTNLTTIESASALQSVCTPAHADVKEKSEDGRRLVVSYNQV